MAIDKHLRWGYIPAHDDDVAIFTTITIVTAVTSPTTLATAKSATAIEVMTKPFTTGGEMVLMESAAVHHAIVMAETAPMPAPVPATLGRQGIACHRNRRGCNYKQ